MFANKSGIEASEEREGGDCSNVSSVLAVVNIGDFQSGVRRLLSSLQSLGRPLI